MLPQTVKMLARRLRVIAVETFSILVILGLVIVAPNLCLAALAGTGLTLAAVAAPFAWSERDWDGDGTTTIGEFYYATDVGRRPVLVNGTPCDELFEFKDGRTIKTVCPGTWSPSQGGQAIAPLGVSLMTREAGVALCRRPSPSPLPARFATG